MPLLTTMPTRISSPIWAIRLNGEPVSRQMKEMPTKANGSASMMAKGWSRDSNRAAMTR